MALSSQKALTNSFRVQNVNNLIDIVNSSNTTGVYVFAGNPSPWTGSDANVPAPTDTVSQFVSTYQNMVFGKKVLSTGVLPMAPRHDWVANTVYTSYIQNDNNLYNESFYVAANQGSQYDIFKCLFNNNGANSTHKPALSETSANATFYQTADGYQWKYMYSIDNTNFANFSTTNYVPILPNANVSGNATPGAIDVIFVNNGGSHYNNFLTGQFAAGDIKIGGDGTVYGISNASGSTTNSYYTGSILTIDSGTGTGQYKTITNYVVAGLVKKVTLDSSFTTVPDATSQWSISPSITVTGDGKQTVNCVARGLVNSSLSNTIYQVQILQRGQGYRFATANVVGSPIVTATAANLTVAIPPPGGHGANSQLELGGTAVGFATTFANNESSTIPTQNDYRTVGLLVDPVFANVGIYTLNSNGVSGSNGTFNVSEVVYQASPIRLRGAATINTTSAVITAANGYFTPVLAAGDIVYMFDNSSGSGQVANVVSSTNTTFTIQSNGAFVSNVLIVAKLSVTATGHVQNVSAGFIQLGNVTGPITANGFLLGQVSYATATVNNYIITGNAKSFSTFSQLSRYIGTLQGTFTQDELVSQVSSGANGYFHSGNSTVAKLFNETGNFTSNDTFVGSQSGAVFSITTKYAGDLIIDSGEVIYLENFQPIARSNSQSESIKIVVTF